MATNQSSSEKTNVFFNPCAQVLESVFSMQKQKDITMQEYDAYMRKDYSFYRSNAPSTNEAKVQHYRYKIDDLNHAIVHQIKLAKAICPKY